MKKLISFSLIGSCLLLGSNGANAEWDYWTLERSGTTLKVYTTDSSTGKMTLRTTETMRDGTFVDSYIDERSGNLIIRHGSNLAPPVGSGVRYREYNLESNSWKDRPDLDTFNSTYAAHHKRGIINQKADGSVHIGENSAVFKEENGREKFWATDASGKSIPIDITNGSKLLINGRDVEQSINNVGALSAALTGLPTVPAETKLACGLGTGTHGGDIAFSGGCASKVNDKLSLNYAAAITMPGQEYAGDFEDTFSARAGFVWQLGKSTKPTKISFEDKKILDKEISSLKKNNDELKAKNDQLLTRIEKLEEIALALKLNPDSEVISLKK